MFKERKGHEGLTVDHFGDKLQLSRSELEDLAFGKVKMDRYPMIPKNMYRPFMMNVADALGIVYRPYMVEAVTPERVERPRYELPEKKEWDKIGEYVEELKKKIERVDGEIEWLERVIKVMEKRKK